MVNAGLSVRVVDPSSELRVSLIAVRQDELTALDLLAEFNAAVTLF